MSHWYEAGEHEGSFSIAGWQAIGGDWQDVEAGGATPMEDSGLGPWDMDQVTVHYVNPETGDDFYFTMSNGPWEDWDSFVEHFEDALDGYGVSE